MAPQVWLAPPGHAAIIRRMTGAHTEAVQDLLRLIEAAGRIATDAERSRADLLVAFVEDGDLPMARVLFGELFGFADARFRQAAWAVVETLMIREAGRGSTSRDS